MGTRSGIFITFEGIDGAGKSSHIEALADHLRAQGRAVLLTREPGGTPLAESIRSLVLHEAMDALTEALLVFAARRDHVVSVILPALNRGEVVLSDRFSDATFAYQGGGRGFDFAVLDRLEQWVQTRDQGPDGSENLLQPDLTLWFDVPAELAARRLASARTPDRFEAQPESFFQRVIDGYARRMALSPGRFERLAADQSREAVWSELIRVVDARFSPFSPPVASP